MGTPYIGEIRIFAGNFAPAGWMFCEGQLLSIMENEALFNLIGTTYGGDGMSTFALPDLRGRLPIHMGTGPDGTTYQIGESGGQEEVTLAGTQIPSHKHALTASLNTGTSVNPANNVPASSPSVQIYIEDAPTAPMHANAAAPAGGSQPHTNMQPYLCVSFIISLYGIYPSPT